jgi:hypothetical protein
MSQVRVSRMSDRLDQRPAASIQLTTSNNENKANRLHPFTEYVTGGRLIKAQRSNDKEAQIDQALMIYHKVSIVQ